MTAQHPAVRDAFTDESLPSPAEVKKQTNVPLPAVPAGKPAHPSKFDDAHKNPPECCGVQHVAGYPYLKNFSGRPKGSLNKTTNFIKNFAKRILEDPELYEESIRRRLRTDTLAPAVEIALLHYAYGKPADKLVVQDERPKLKDTGETGEMVDARVQELLDAAVKTRFEERKRELAEAEENILPEKSA